MKNVRTNIDINTIKGIIHNNWYKATRTTNSIVNRITKTRINLKSTLKLKLPYYRIFNHLPFFKGYIGFVPLPSKSSFFTFTRLYKIPASWTAEILYMTFDLILTG